MRIYMIGIGGIGMSALAQLYISEGHSVSGSDREHSPTTELLQKKGVEIFFEQKSENIPQDAVTVVYSDAIGEENPERVRAKALGIRQISYFEALGEISKGKNTIAVSGTHGKTTVTAMLVKILKDAGKEPTGIIGSLISEFGSNFVEGAREEAGKERLFVIEACEYKDHVLELSPNMLVLTNVEWDHTDWFPSLASLQEMFGRAVAALPQIGVLVTAPTESNILPILAKTICRVVDYTKETVPELLVPGVFNLANAKAAKAAARTAFPDISESTIDASLANFKGAWRRFELKGETPEGSLVYDDYAHHPSAILATLKAAREKFPEKKIVVAFHPHLYTRTRDLMKEFAESFSDANEVLLSPIYPAREAPIEGITSEALAEKITEAGTHAEALPSLDAIYERLEELSSLDVVIFTMGAGDIYKVSDRLVLKTA